MGPVPPHCLGSVITLRRATPGRNILDDLSPCRRELDMTTHSTFKRHTSTPPAGFETSTPASERPHTHVLDQAAIGIQTFL